MALTDTTKLDWAFKALKALGMTSTAKAYYEETEAGGIILDNSYIWTGSIPTTPPTVTTGDVKPFVSGTTLPGRLLLTVDTSVASSKAWKAVSGAAPTGSILKEWVTPSYGNAYAVRIYRSDNTTEIPTTDASDWLFDYKAGVLAFQDACPDTGGIYLHGYYYQGNKALPRSSGATIAFIIDGGSQAITVGEKGHLEIPFNCSIKKVDMFANQTGSITVDIWKDTYANYPPTDADTITSATPPTITSSNKSSDSTLSGWTTSINAGDILAFNVDSCGSIQRVSINLNVVKS